MNSKNGHEINAVAATNFQNYKLYLKPFLYKPKVKGPRNIGDKEALAKLATIS